MSLLSSSASNEPFFRQKRSDDTATTLHFEGFFDSVFELVDLWVDSVDAKDYIAFLKQLIDEVTETVEAGTASR